MGVTERPVEVSMGDGASRSGIWVCHFVSCLGSRWQSRALCHLLQKCQLFAKFYSEDGK